MLLLAVVQVPPLVANVQPPVILVMVSLGVSLEGSHALMGNIVALSLVAPLHVPPKLRLVMQ